MYTCVCVESELADLMGKATKWSKTYVYCSEGLFHLVRTLLHDNVEGLRYMEKV